VISDLGSGGAQRVLLHLVESWHSAGRHVTVITLSNPEQDFFRLPKGVPRITIGGIAESRSLLAGLRANFQRVRRLRRALQEARAPIAVAFVAQTAVLTRLAAIGLPLRVVAAERNDPQHQDLGPIWNCLRRFAYRRADLVTANSRGVVEGLADFVPRSKLAFLPNPLALPPLCDPAPVAAPTILSIGRLNRQKAHSVLLRAFAQFAGKRPDWRLAIMGEGPDETSLRELASSLGIAGKVDFLGRQASPYPYLRACRLFVVASRHEGMPNALLEAMSCGMPCIVSNSSPGLLELIQDGDNGLVVPVDNEEALAGAIELLAADPSFAEVLGRQARQAVKAYASEIAVKTWEEVLGLRTNLDTVPEQRNQAAKRTLGNVRR
jgi:glycosyltransferase involved in cell wall biosynthesis